MSDADNKLDELVKEFDAFKDRLKEIYEELGLGKDELLRAHDALDLAAEAVTAHGHLGGHDLNDDLAAKPEDHPAVQGQVSTPINMDDPAADPEVSNTPEPAKDEAETPVAAPDSGMSVQAHDGDAV
jgi:hypothetical protein